MERQTGKYNPGLLPRQAELSGANAVPARDSRAAGRASSGLGWVGNPRRTHLSNPPWITPTRSYPRFMRIRARLALVASAGQVQ